MSFWRGGCREAGLRGGQLVKDLLARMIANITACQCLVARTAQLDVEGTLTDAQAALSKSFSTSKCRETVAGGVGR